MNFVEKHIFRIVSGDSPKTMGKLYLSTEFSLQEVRWNYGIFRSVGLWALSKTTRPRLPSITEVSVKLCKVGYHRVTPSYCRLLINEENKPKIELRFWCRNPKIFSFRDSFSFKSLKKYYNDSIFNFKLTYFVVSRKETAVDINNSIS